MRAGAFPTGCPASGRQIAAWAGALQNIRSRATTIHPSANGGERHPMDMNVGLLAHYNVATSKLDETFRFYQAVLVFENGPRPAFNFPGACLYSAGHPVLHLNDISGTDRQQRPDSGVIDHI